MLFGALAPAAVGAQESAFSLISNIIIQPLPPRKQLSWFPRVTRIGAAANAGAIGIKVSATQP